MCAIFVLITPRFRWREGLFGIHILRRSTPGFGHCLALLSSAGLNFSVTPALSEAQYIFHTMKWQKQMSDPTKSVPETHARSQKIEQP